MAPVANVLAGVLAFGCAANARGFRDFRDTAHGNFHRTHLDSNSPNLLSLRQQDGPLDSTPIIRDAAPAQILKPMRPNRGAATTIQAGVSGQDAPSPKDAMGLRAKHPLYWGLKDGTTAELEVRMPGEAEGIIDMEQFDDMIESMECPGENEASGPVSIRFKEQANFDTAADVWDWVNQQPDRHFHLMVGAGDCKWNQDRMLYRVQDLEFDNQANTAVLQAKSATWKEALHSYRLKVKKDPSKAQSLAVRQDDEEESDFSIPIDVDLTGKGVNFNMNGVDYTGFCANCTSFGSFDVNLDFEVGFFELDKAVVELSTPGIDTEVTVDIILKGELTDTLLEKEFPLFKFSPAGISIPGLVSVGPTIDVALKAGVDAIKGGVKLTVGGTARIPPSSATLDFLSEEGTTSEGWEVETESSPIEADVFVEARASVSLAPSVGLELSALETGFAAKLTAELPVLAAVMRAITSPTCGACDQGFQNAIEGLITLGTSLGLALQKKVGGNLEDLWSLSLFDASIPPLASLCEPVGPQPLCPPNGTFVGRI